MLIGACGLDTIIYLEPPQYLRNQASEQASEQYIEFNTSDSLNTPAYCRGFEVFYKIYASKENLQSDVVNINSYNSSSPQNAARWLLETKHYHRLRSDTEPAVKATGTNRRIKIRLFNYGTKPEDKAGLYIDEINVGQVKRSNGADFEVLPAETSDADVSINASAAKTAGGYCYVAFFTATVGMDEHFTALYSQLLYLGFLVLQ